METAITINFFSPERCLRNKCCTMIFHPIHYHYTFAIKKLTNNLLKFYNLYTITFCIKNIISAYMIHFKSSSIIHIIEFLPTSAGYKTSLDLDFPLSWSWTMYKVYGTFILRLILISAPLVSNPTLLPTSVGCLETCLGLETCLETVFVCLASRLGLER